MWGTEPDGTGRHGVRVAGVEAPHGVAESAGVPGVSGEATEPGRAGVARQAAGAAGGQSDRGAGNGAGRAGGPIGGDGARSGRDPAPAGSEAGAATAVPGAGGALPLSGPPGAVRGAHLRYLVYASEPAATVVACVQFSSAAWRIAVRDRWIGWEAETRARQLVHVVSNSRYLVLPWVQVKNLASRILSRAVRQLAVDWPRSYGVEVFLVETLVDPERYRGSCYRGANWIELGSTRGGKREDRLAQSEAVRPKRVLVYPLVAEAARRLREG